MLSYKIADAMLNEREIQMSKFAIGNILGVLILLIGCIFTFQGPMIPAMWQLLSVFWVAFWSLKCMKEDTK